MAKLIMLAGLPGSGKGLYAEGLSVNENAKILSSDNIRVELCGNEDCQDKNTEVFELLYKRAKEHLNNNKNVVIDATNISSKRRIHNVGEFKKHVLECHYLDTPFGICLQRDRNRSRTVGYGVIDRMYKSLQVPSLNEGWNDIKYVHTHTEAKVDSLKDYFESVITQECSYSEMFYEAFQGAKIFENISDLPQDSSYHRLSVSRHTYHVWEHVLNNYEGKEKLVMLWAALLHDIGKLHCKDFREGSRYANFIGHENVSAQLACNFLSWIGYEDNFVSKVVELVQFHMKLLSIGESEKGIEKLRRLVGEDVLLMLKSLREADELAH
ncbi:AAA family ATPase [Paenibacillus tianjinensis]|uniref:AAA family ATPase n=1 Tax=Paenibacillus tianjinensis TaxID=2810347 RepID=A0ABX7L5P7_9BACL|nr:AAA family ATPase [Paenibacillus tianjinensis]QSF43440.1 AAA family ATPase [Paenibacillus tianjinensis]